MSDEDFELVDEFDAARSSEDDESWGEENELEKEPEELQLSEEEEYILPDTEQVDHEQTQQVRCGWLALSEPVMIRSNSNESWDRLSVVSIDFKSDVSECGVNSMAIEIIEQSQASYDEKLALEDDLAEKTENDLLVSNEKKAPSDPTKTTSVVKRKKKKKKQRVSCGLVLFRSEGAEVCLIDVPSIKGLSLVHQKMKKGETPLQTALRGFQQHTGCVSSSQVSILPHVTQMIIKKGKELCLYFPAICTDNLHYMPCENTVDWWPTDAVTRRNKKLPKIITSIVKDAVDLLHKYAHDLPTIVSEEIAQMSEMAQMSLVEVAAEEKVGVTSAEIRDFLKRNHEDLKAVVEGADKESLKAMLRKLVRQLPGNSGISTHIDDNPKPVIEPVNQENLAILKSLIDISRSKKSGKIKWKKLEEYLQQALTVLTDDKLLLVLTACDFKTKTQTFSKKNKENREAILMDMIANLESTLSV